MFLKCSNAYSYKDSWSISLFKLATLQNSKNGEVGLQLKFEYKPEIRAEITSWEFIQNKNVLLCGTDTGTLVSLYHCYRCRK